MLLRTKLVTRVFEEVEYTQLLSHYCLIIKQFYQ